IPTTKLSSISWAGSGQLLAGNVRFAADHLGVIGTVVAGVNPAGPILALTGSGKATQLFADGQPLLATTASIDRIRTEVDVAAGDPNSSSYVTWAPRNTGTIDMAMTAVHVQEGPGDWVNLELQALPAMFGGEPVPPVGGDSTGLGDRGRGGLFGSDHASAIRSYLGPKAADRRDLSLDVPDSTPAGDYRIVLQIEGNFDPVTFDATIHVRAPG
ncbi:MAG: hypothetical protein QOE63_1856, partial [Acidimicrobiaceae bacterium]